MHGKPATRRSHKDMQQEDISDLDDRPVIPRYNHLDPYAIQAFAIALLKGLGDQAVDCDKVLQTAVDMTIKFHDWKTKNITGDKRCPTRF